MITNTPPEHGSENHLLILRLGKVLNSVLDINTLLNELMQLDRQLMQVEACSLMLLDPERQELVFEVAQGEKGQVLRQHRLPAAEGICGWVVTHDQAIIVNNAAVDPRFNPGIDAQTGFTTRSVLAVPLESNGKVIGVIEVLNKLSGEDFTEEDLHTLTALGGQAAAALESARAYQNLKQERDKIIKTEEDIRRELVRELRAGPLQKLAAVEMNAEFAEKLMALNPDRAHAELQRLRVMVRDTTDEVRGILFDLRPLVLETHGLVAALQSHVRQLAEEGFSTPLEVEGLLGRLPPEKERAAFSVIREALLNAREHGHASGVRVGLSLEEGTLVATVRDDGRGFDPTALLEARDRRKGYGLFQMREKAERVGGSLAIESTVGEGTAVTLRMPL